MNSPVNFRVLYADDDVDSCEMISIMLNFAHIEVTTATTVAKAWHIAQREKFDLYLLDSRFPDGDGLELCRQLRQYAPQTPILMLSANAFQSDVKLAMEAGANDYLMKPFLGDLTQRILQSFNNTELPLAKKRDEIPFEISGKSHLCEEPYVST